MLGNPVALGAGGPHQALSFSRLWCRGPALHGMQKLVLCVNMVALERHCKICHNTSNKRKRAEAEGHFCTFDGRTFPTGEAQNNNGTHEGWCEATVEIHEQHD